MCLALGLVTGSNAFAHGDHGDEPFAPVLRELVDAQFRVRPLPAYEPTSYFEFPNGKRMYLDSKLRAAALEMAESMVEHAPTEDDYADLQWREWTKYYAHQAGDGIKHLFSRRFVLEVSGSGVQAFYRFGLMTAALVVAAEVIEHTIITPILPGVPLCQLVIGSCVYVSSRAQEIANVLSPANLRPLTLTERWSRWASSRRTRAEVRRAMKRVYTVGEQMELMARARNLSYRDIGPGAGKIYGGWFSRGFFASVLGNLNPTTTARAADAETPRAAAPSIDLKTVVVPMMADLFEHKDEVARVMRTEEYLAFIDLIFQYAHLAAEDLTRVTEYGHEHGHRVKLRTTWRKTPGFLGLNRDLARMQKSFDLYAFGLRMRAAQAGPRSLESQMVDENFARSFSTFLKAYNARIDEVEAMSDVTLDPASDLRTQPEQALSRVRNWMRTNRFCDALLGLTGPNPAMATP